MARPWFEKTRHAIVTTAHSFIGAKNVQSFLINYKAGNEQVEFAVVVIIKPDGAGGPTRRGDSGFISHISKRAIAVIVIEDIAAITSHVKINPTVAIIVAGGDAHAERAAGHSGFVSHICEGAIVVVVVESIPERSVRRKEI